MECTLTDGKWLTGSHIELTNTTISFESVKHVPGSLGLGDGAHVMCHGTLYVEKNLEVHGDCAITSTSGGLIAARSLVLVAGSITTDKVRYLKMDYLCITRRNNGTFDIDVPVVVLKAIRPGMLKVNIEELTLWSHSSGVELVFDVPSVTKDGGVDYQGAIGYEPVHVRNLKTFASNIPVNVRFEYGSVVGQLTLNAFVTFNSGRKYSLLEYDNHTGIQESPIQGRVVFNYYAETEDQKSYHHGFTDVSSIFEIGSETANVTSLFVYVRGASESPSDLLICFSSEESRGACPIDRGLIWVSVEDNQTWVNHVTEEIRNITFMIEHPSFEIDLSHLNPNTQYSLTLTSEGTSRVRVYCPENICKAVRNLTLEKVEVSWPGSIGQLRQLSVYWASIEPDDKEKADGMFQRIGRLECDIESLEPFRRYFGVIDELWLTHLVDIQRVNFKENGWEFQNALTGGTLAVKFDPKERMPVHATWPSGSFAEFLISIDSDTAPRCTLHSSVGENSLIRVGGTPTWKLFCMDARSNRYSVTFHNHSEVFPFELNLSEAADYKLDITSLVMDQNLSIVDAIQLGPGANFQIVTDNSFNTITFANNVTLRGGQITFGTLSAFHLTNLHVVGDRQTGNSISGGVIDNSTVLADGALLRLRNTTLTDSRFVLDIQSEVDTPTLIMDNVTLPKKIDIVHEFQDQQYKDELKWYWSNHNPIICWDSGKMRDILDITTMQVVGSPYFHISLTPGTSLGRQCGNLHRSYERRWTQSMICGFVLGTVVIVSATLVIALKCSTGN